MNILSLFSRAGRIRASATSRLEHYSKPNTTFFVMIALSSAIASLGTALNNMPVVIGAMLVAPLITPLFGFALGLLTLNSRIIGRTLVAIILGSLLAVAVSCIAGLVLQIFSPLFLTTNQELLTVVLPFPLFFWVALLSGMAGAYAWVKHDSVGALPGVAIAVALVPPLARLGLHIVLLQRALITETVLLVLLNLLGIVLGSVIMFALLGFGEESKLE